MRFMSGYKKISNFRKIWLSTKVNSSLKSKTKSYISVIMENYDNSKKHVKYKIKSRNSIHPRLNSSLLSYQGVFPQ